MENVLESQRVITEQLTDLTSQLPQIGTEGSGNITLQQNFVTIDSGNKNEFNISSCPIQTVAGGGVIDREIPAGTSRTGSVREKDTALMKQAIEEVIEAIAVKRKVNAIYSHQNHDTPVVTPRLSKVSFYEGGFLPDGDVYTPSTDRSLIGGQGDLTFEELIQLWKEKRYIALIGDPGCGKTVLSDRLETRCGCVCFHLKFMNLNYDSATLITLKELLLDFAHPELDQHTRDLAFEWVMKNQSKCSIMLDGYDQARWAMKENPPKVSYVTKSCVSDVISNLCCGNFLPMTQVLVTSRPYMMLPLPIRLRPHTTVYIQDLNFNDMRVLFHRIAGAKAEVLWDTINKNAPQLLSLCLNPLMLNYTVNAYLSQEDTKIDVITTSTQLFSTVLEMLRRSKHTKHADITNLREKLGQIAYKATRAGTVLITDREMKAQGLDASLVQDVMVCVMGYRGCTDKLYDDDTLLCFSHQCLQEYLSAHHIVFDMAFGDFKKFVKEKLDTDHWAVVRRFVSGLLIDNKRYKEKRVIIRRRLNIPRPEALYRFRAARKLKGDWYLQNTLSKYRKLCARQDQRPKDSTKKRILDIMMQGREFNSREITKYMASCFPSINANFSFTSLSISEAHAIGLILRHVSKKVFRLGFYNCSMDSNAFVHICDAIINMRGTVDEMYIMCNNLSSVEDICRILVKINCRLTMWGCFNDEAGGMGRNANEHEQRLLQQSLNSIVSTELEIDVGTHIIRQTIRRKTVHSFITPHTAQTDREAQSLSAIIERQCTAPS
uniref:uncharacterized protein LOC101242293 isoform X2 n=1 Tax=Ciona intestinalis TaxID=7719 RepID=UPI000EF44BF0|nr:uncharacterized protein LOC101242293 isoform X2 [Ciona intestinalis]|eukprot:XP_026690615.1 uncharacterized protein LOC101242293 isoform X2 [Ciona intestinalis]